MRNLTIILIVLSLFSCSKEKKEYQSFGAEINEKETVLVEDMVAKSTNEKQAFKIKGTVKDVCQMKGCWMTLENGSGIPVRVRFKDYAFFVPKDISGQEVIVKGVASKSKLSKKMAKHYAEDAGKPYDSTVTHFEIAMMADGVLVEKSK